MATELAREIEGNQTSRVDVELEDGNEEEAFSAVTRPQRGLCTCYTYFSIVCNCDIVN